MKSSIVKTISIALVSGASLLMLSGHASGQLLRENRSIEARGPFIARSLVSGGLARDHIIEIGVAEVEVTGLVIECFNLNDASDVVVRNSEGVLVEAEISVEPTKINITLAEPALPGDSLEVNIEGIDFVQDGDATFYFVSARTSDTGEDFAVPVGSARILSANRGSSNR